MLPVRRRIDRGSVSNALGHSQKHLYTWDAAHPGHALEIIPGEKESISSRVVRRVRGERDAHPGAIITVILADRIRTRSVLAPFTHRHSLAIKSRLLFEPSVVVTDLNVPARSRRSKLTQVPTRAIEQVVLVSDMTRPIREALTYAQQLGPEVTAVHIDVDHAQRERLVRHWDEAGHEFPFVIVPSPYRSIVGPLVRYLRERRGWQAPERSFRRWSRSSWFPGVTQLLHNQTGPAIKGILAAEAGIAVTSVPFHLEAHGYELADSWISENRAV